MKTRGESSGRSPGLIAYCALHQRISSVTPSDYRNTMRSFHEHLHVESRRFHTFALQQRDNLDRTLARSISALVGTTDPRIEKNILNALVRSRQESPVSGLMRSTETEVIEIAPRDPFARKLCRKGEEYLQDLGFTGTLPSSVYESSFVIQGSENLDNLEILVRDVLGIYGGTHGKHLKEFGQYSYAVYNLLREGTGTAAEQLSNGFHESSLYFSKPDPDVIKYAPFRKQLVEMLSAVERSIGLSTSLWQRKLGLGVGAEFILRINFRERERLDEVVSALAGTDANPVVRSALLDRGSMVTRQVSFAQSVAIDG